MNKLKNILLGCFVGLPIAWALMFMLLQSFNMELEVLPPKILLFVTIIGVMVGGVLGAFLGQVVIPKSVDFPLKSLLTWTFGGLIITFILPHAMYLLEYGLADNGSPIIYMYKGPGFYIRHLMMMFFVPGCALAGLLIGLSKKTK